MEIMLVPSLERTALTSISAALWKIGWSHDVEDPASLVCRRSLNFHLWKNKVYERAQKLIIPEILKEKLLGIADAMGNQIESWADAHVYRWRIVDRVPETFVWTWTSFGVIDLQKTANLVVCDDVIDIGSRFRLACIYCLEEHILTLYNQIDEGRVSSIIDLGLEYPREELTHFMSDSCDYFLAKQSRQRDTVKVYPPGCSPIELFEKSLQKSGFCVAAKFFYLESVEKQTNETIVPIINRALTVFWEDNICYYDLQDIKTFSFLLNHMNKDQQIQVLSSAPRVVLFMLCNWPCREMYIEVYQLVGHLLSVGDFHSTLSEIMHKKNCQQCDYERVFILIWQKASVECKKFVYTYYDDDISEWFGNLCENENWYACSLLLEDAPANMRTLLEGASEPKRERWFMLWFRYVIEYFTSLIVEGKCNKIECFLTICHLSNLEIVIFRDEIIKHSEFPPDTEEKVELFNNIIDALITANEMKRHIENNESEPKRFCRAES